MCTKMLLGIGVENGVNCQCQQKPAYVLAINHLPSQDSYIQYLAFDCIYIKRYGHYRWTKWCTIWVTGLDFYATAELISTSEGKSRGGFNDGDRDWWASYGGDIMGLIWLLLWFIRPRAEGPKQTILFSEHSWGGKCIIWQLDHNYS